MTCRIVLTHMETAYNLDGEEREPMTTAEQTETCERLRQFLQSIATQSVQAQDEIGNPDTLLDTLEDVSRDLKVAVSLAVSLAKG